MTRLVNSPLYLLKIETHFGSHPFPRHLQSQRHIRRDVDPGILGHQGHYNIHRYDPFLYDTSIQFGVTLMVLYLGILKPRSSTENVVF